MVRNVIVFRFQVDLIGFSFDSIDFYSMLIRFQRILSYTPPPKDLMFGSHDKCFLNVVRCFYVYIRGLEGSPLILGEG